MTHVLVRCIVLYTAYSLHSEPYNLAQQTGAYEVLKSTSSSHGNIIRQMVLEYPCAWCQAEKANSSISLIGNYSWYAWQEGIHGIIVITMCAISDCFIFEAL